jgi:hypothetical protein
MRDLLIIFIILLVLLILISTLGGSLNLPSNTIQAFTQPMPTRQEAMQFARPIPRSVPAPARAPMQEANHNALKIEPFDASTQYASI